jgi:prepilin-type N-terminal cleavage/methylation domain-containing protein
MSTTNRTAARSQAGFTLVEALIAMVVLSFGLIAVTNLMLVAATSNSVANQSSAATSIASQQLELLKACKFTDPQLTAGGDLVNDAANFFTDTDVPGVGQIHTRWQITNVDGTTKYIVVRSEGTGALAGPRSRAQFTTLRVQQPTS